MIGRDGPRDGLSVDIQFEVVGAAGDEQVKVIKLFSTLPDRKNR